jgi:ribose 5-phosphate isomerase B
MIIYIGADHRGFQLKETLKAWLQEQGNQIMDCGNTVYDLDDDYPDYTFPVAAQVAADTSSKGIVICGSGVGVAIAANKVDGIRAASALNADEVRHGRKHDAINILALSADYTSVDQAKVLVETFLKTPFDAEEQRFIRRFQKIENYEKTGQYNNQQLAQ